MEAAPQLGPQRIVVGAERLQVVDPLDDDGQRFGGLQGLRDGGVEALEELDLLAVEQLDEQLVLGLEVGVERPAGETGPVADVLDGRGREPALGEDRTRGIQQALAGGRPAALEG